MKPIFQMPFMVHQKWRASTYDGHSPDQDSIDLIYVSGASAAQPVFASAAGKVIEAHDTNSATPPYGSVVTIDHGDGWKTQYIHLDDQLSVTKDQTVVRGQQIGRVGNIAGLEPHLHYTQLLNGKAVRITFNSVEIAVHAGARKPDGTYPKQELISNNYPTGIQVNSIANGVSVTCAEGAGVRAALGCENTHTGIEVTRYGSWTGAKGTSTAKCGPGQLVTDRSADIR